MVRRHLLEWHRIIEFHGQGDHGVLLAVIDPGRGIAPAFLQAVHHARLSASSRFLFAGGDHQPHQLLAPRLKLAMLFLGRGGEVP